MRSGPNRFLAMSIDIATRSAAPRQRRSHSRRSIRNSALILFGALAIFTVLSFINKDTPHESLRGNAAQPAEPR